MAGNHSAAVLRNKGVAIEVYETVEVADVATERVTYEVARTDKGTPRVITTWVRFDGNSLADLEDAFGDLGEFQKATTTNPFTAIRRALAILFGWDDAHPRLPDGKPEPSGRACPGCRRAGLAMKEGGANDYSTAVVAALSLANGLDPTRVVKMIEVGTKAAEGARTARMAELDEMLDLEAAVAVIPDASTSTAGSNSGSEPAEATTSSGA
jgi:hypothetical protein